MRLKALFILTFCMAFNLSQTSVSNAQKVNIMPNYLYELETIRPENDENGDFTIRLLSPGSVTGCYKINPAEIEIVDAGAAIYVKIEEGSIELQTEATYDQFGCQITSGQQFIDINFNKNDLADNKTGKIIITSKSIGKLFDIEVETDDHSVTLHSELKTGVRAPSDVIKRSIRHWFFPENTIILSANGMTTDPETAKKVKDLAEEQELKPMKTMFDDFKSPKDGLFYIDSENKFSEDLKENLTVPVGSISFDEQYFGANGPYTKSKKIGVFARKVGIND
ncbi:MAG: hypothetical protein AB8B83_00635 [Bdellovibrionales bacterium]